MNPLNIINKYYKSNPNLREILLIHSKKVAEKAIKIAKKLNDSNIDIQFIEEAAMLHDIGIFLTHNPEIHCNGDKPYICHGYLGRELLDIEGYFKHALVCERHTGVGLSIKDIEQQKLPIPKRDMQAISIEEKIISFADLYYSKKGEFLIKEKSNELIQKQLSHFGIDKVQIFENWLARFT